MTFPVCCRFRSYIIDPSTLPKPLKNIVDFELMVRAARHLRWGQIVVIESTQVFGRPASGLDRTTNLLLLNLAG